jgi:hypothetical protein
MGQQNNHIIEKVFLEVNTRSKELAYNIKDNSRTFLENSVFPVIESVLEKYSSSGSVIRIDKLNLDISVDGEQLENDKGVLSLLLKNKLDDAIKRGLDRAKSKETDGNENESMKGSSGVEILSALNDVESAFLFFLENGHLPWYGQKKSLFAFVTSGDWGKSVENDEFVMRLSRLVNKDAKIRSGFLGLLPAGAVVSFLIREERKLKGYEDVLFSFFEETDMPFKTALFEVLTLKTGKQVFAALKMVADTLRSGSGKIDEVQVRGFVEMLRYVLQDEFKEEKTDEAGLIENILSKDTQADHPIRKEDKSTPKKLSEERAEIPEKFFSKTDVREVFVVNAGLILLHPFFGQLFGTLGFLDDKKMILKSKTDIAVQTLHYIATGSEKFFEGDLLLEKFICNIPLKWPVNTESLLTKKIKDEVEVMMQEAVRHWPALKNTSPGGLRQMFISRDGKLIEQPKGYKLIVERKAQDVLLEKLNWNISLVKFPWKKELITVEW